MGREWSLANVLPNSTKVPQAPPSGWFGNVPHNPSPLIIPRAAPGKPYTGSQWSSLPGKQQGFKTYQRYLQWWNQNVGPKMNNPDRKPAVATPGGTMPPGLSPNQYAQLLVQPATVKQVPYPRLPAYFNPISQAALQAQAQQQVNAKINPVLDQINKQYADLIAQTGKQYDTASAQGQAGINASAQGWLNAQQQDAANQQATYAQATQQQQGVNDAIQAFLQRSGQQTMDPLVAQAQAAGAPMATTAGFQGGASPLNVAGATRGAQAEQTGIGASALSSLIAQGAANVAGAQAMPGLIRNYQANDLASFLQDQSTKRATALSDLANQQTGAIGQVTGQTPGLIQDVLSTLLDRETTKAQARAQYGQDRNTAVQNVRNQNAANLQQARIANAGFMQGVVTSAAKGGASPYEHVVDKFGNQWTFDKQTGKWTYAGPPGTSPRTSAPAKPGTPGSGATGYTRGDKIDAGADKMVQRLFSQVHPATKTPKVDPTTGASQGYTTVPSRPVDNDKAYQAIYNYYLRAYPGQSANYILGKARAALIAGGYQKAGTDMKDVATYKAYVEKMQEGYKAQQLTSAIKTSLKILNSLNLGKGTGPTIVVGKPGQGGQQPGGGGKGGKNLTPQQQAQQRAQNASYNAQTSGFIEKTAATDVNERIKGGAWNVKGAPGTSGESTAAIASYLTAKYQIPENRARAIAATAVANARK